MKTFEELERAAYITGQTELADALARIVELETEVEALENAAADVVTLESWEKNNGPAKEYYEFFHDCFARLNDHYPCPEVTSDYDEGVGGWKGNVLGRVEWLTHGRVGFARNGCYVSVTDIHGGKWYGKNADLGMCITLRPTKGSV